MKLKFLLLLFLPVLAMADPMYSPTWGFYIDLPEGYEYADGDAKDRFSFIGPSGLIFDIVVYNDRYSSIRELASDVNRQLSNRGDTDFFQYRDRQAAIFKLTFGEYVGWGLAVELDAQSGRRPYLLALSYNQAGNNELELFHLSALDSIAPSIAERRCPGPVMEYSFPRGEAKNTPLVLRSLSVPIRANDAEAAQVLVEREFAILSAYLNTPMLQDASIRYYRFIYRDSYDRVASAAAALARNFGAQALSTDIQKREFAQRALSFVQNFTYERDLRGSDFVNLVTAVTEGRGDCDSRAMLFAIIMAQVDIRSAIMLSHHYSHAMGLADIPGSGARFEAYGTPFLVAETTAKINIGLIDQEISNPAFWFAVVFE